MLTNKELELAANHEGPLGGRRLLDSAWADRDIADAFVEWARAEHFAYYLLWWRSDTPERMERYFMQKVCDLEHQLVEASMDPIRDFVQWLPEERGRALVAKLQEALGLPLKVRKPKLPKVADKSTLRETHRLMRVLTQMFNQKEPLPRQLVEQLRDHLAEVGSYLADEATAVLDEADAPDPMKTYSILYMGGATLPLAEPLILQLNTWIREFDGDPIALVASINADWLPRLRAMDEEDRHEAIEVLRRKLPGETEGLGSLIVQLLQ